MGVGSRAMNVSEPDPDSGEMAYNFAIVGVQKGGTSTLAVTLNQHRLVCQPPDKERHFFDDETVDWSAPDYARDYTAPRRAPIHRLRRRRHAHLPLLAAARWSGCGPTTPACRSSRSSATRSSGSSRTG